MTIRNLLRAASLFAVMLAGSCAAPLNTTGDLYDPDQIHPITVEPSFQSLKVSFSTREAGLMPDDESHFMDFVQAYADHGNGSISVSAPDGPDSQNVLHYFGDRIADMGVQPSRILVGTHPSTGDDHVEISYVTYIAHADACGNWTNDVSGSSSNLPPANFGCANQHNIAAMIADPRDLEEPRSMGPTDAARRADIVGKYEKGAVTSAEKRKGDLGNEQSGSGLGN